MIPIQSTPVGSLLSGPAIREEAWTVDSTFPYGACPAVDDRDQVYVGTLSGETWAVEGASGRRLWSAHTDLLGAAPVVGPLGHVYAAAVDGKVSALDPLDGHAVWQQPVPAHFVDPLLPAGDRALVIRSQEGALYGIDAASGSCLWSRPCAAPVWTAPVATPDGVAVALSPKGERLEAVDAVSGKELWHLPLPGRLASLAAGPPGIVYVGWKRAQGLQWTPVVRAVDTRSGATKWERDALDGPVWDEFRLGASPGDVAVLTTSKGHVVALRASDGARAWTHDIAGGDGELSPPVTGPRGTVYVTQMDRAVQRLDAASGAPSGDFAAPKSSSVSAPAPGGDDAVYFVDDGGALHGSRRHAVTAQELVDAAPVATRPPGKVELADDHVIVDGVWVPRRQCNMLLTTFDADGVRIAPCN